MPIFSKPFLIISSLLFCMNLVQPVSAQSIKDIQEYCQSMGSSGMSEEDAKSFMDECIAEQSSYLEQEIPNKESYEDTSNYESSYDSSYDSSSESSYEPAYEEPQYEQEDYGMEQNCYAKVDEQIQGLLDSNPNSEFDYDQLVDQCLKGNL